MAGGAIALCLILRYTRKNPIACIILGRMNYSAKRLHCEHMKHCQEDVSQPMCRFCVLRLGCAYLIIKVNRRVNDFHSIIVRIPDGSQYCLPSLKDKVSHIQPEEVVLPLCQYYNESAEIYNHKSSISTVIAIIGPHTVWQQYFSMRRFWNDK